MDLSELSTDELIEKAIKARNKVNEKMNTECVGGLTFGWDWPTATALFPDECEKWYALKAEIVRRGLATIK